MKKLAAYALALLAVGSIIFFSGPRPVMDDRISFEASDIGDDPDSYLKKRETAISGLRTGTEKEIVWFDPENRTATDLAIVYVHGFSATKHEIRPVPDNVAAVLGANLYYIRLAGHGQSGEAMARVTTADWVNDYAEAMEIGRRIGKRTLVISTSTGSTLAAWAADKPEYSENLAGIVMLSPNFELQAISTSLANIPWAETILPAIAGHERSWEPVNEDHGKWWTSRYPTSALFPMVALMRNFKRIDTSSIETPALFIYSPDDKVIVPGEVEKVAAAWGGPSKIVRMTTETDPYHHVIAGDILSPANTGPVTQMIVQWAQGL